MIVWWGDFVDEKDTVESISIWSKQDKLKQTVMAGIHGHPEVKYSEKISFLGEFKERIIKKLSINQVKEKAIYPEILQSLQDVRATKMIINGSINGVFTKKYRELVMKMKKNYIIRNDPSFIGDTGILVVSDEFVDDQDIDIEEREVRLSRLGVPQPLIEAAGQKVCDSCLATIAEIHEDELINYRELTWMDRLSGDVCPAHQ